jgi:hypothetical protein
MSDSRSTVEVIFICFFPVIVYDNVGSSLT